MQPIISEDLALFKEVLAQHVGFVFPSGLESEFSYRLARALEGSNLTMPQLLNQLRYITNPAVACDLLAPFLPQLLIGETYFWREPDTFEALTKVILPELAERKAAHIHLFRAWSAACSSGEETYSLSILLRRFFANSDWALSILGTDINELSLQRARLGEYNEYSFRGLAKEHWLYGCFEAKEGLRPRWRIKDAYRSNVRFQSLNLAGTNYPSLSSDTCNYDLIFCRNIFIYFRPELSAQIVERLYNSLNDGGYLVVSPCEYSNQLFRQFEPVQIGGATFYRRPLQFPVWHMPPLNPPTPLTWPVSPPKQVLPKQVSPTPTKPLAEAADFVASASDKAGLLARIKDALQENLLEGARQASLQFCTAYPLEATGYLLLTIIANRLVQFSEAYEAARKAVYLEPTNPEGLFYLANLHQQLNNPKRASQTYRRLLALTANTAQSFEFYSDLTLAQVQAAARQSLAQLACEEM